MKGAHKPVFFSFTTQEVLGQNGYPTLWFQVTCSTTHPGKIVLPQGGQESPEQSWTPTGRKWAWSMQVKYNQHLSACFKPLNCQWGGAEDERGSLLIRGRTKWESNHVRRRLTKLIISISFQVSACEFRIVKLIRWCAITRAIVCGSCWDSSDNFFFFHFSFH